MTITRKGFFGALLAPFMARFLPKPKSVPGGTDADRLDILNRVTMHYLRDHPLLLDGGVYIQEPFMYSVRGTGWMTKNLGSKIKLDFDPKRLPT